MPGGPAAGAAATSLAPGGGAAARVEALLQRHWWRTRPSWLARSLQPLSLLYGALLARHRKRRPPPLAAPVPTLVVGNFIVGGAGKTPTVIAIVQALQAAGHRPGIVSRGHGRSGADVQAVLADDCAAVVGDEPLLLRRRTGVPVWVGGDRVAAAQALCRQHPTVDVLVSDDGLQHDQLARRADLAVFDERGAGNGLLLPAGPLREPLPLALPPRMRVLYTGGGASTVLPGFEATRSIATAWPLAAWQAGDVAVRQPLQALRGRPLLAVAGMAAPEKFFGMLQAAGLAIARLPMPDHHPYRTLPWPAGTPDVVTTEKDAVKLVHHELGSTRVWVVPLDLGLPSGLVADILSLLFQPSHPSSTTPRHEP